MKFIIPLAVLVLPLLLSGCASAARDVSVEVSCDDFSENQHITDEVRIAKGGTVTLTLCSNPSTGLQWEPTVCCPLRSVILVELEHQYYPPEEKDNTSPALGEQGREVWVYQGVNEGAASISLDYRRPGESGERGEWTYSLMIEVK